MGKIGVGVDRLKNHDAISRVEGIYGVDVDADVVGVGLDFFFN